MSAMSDGQTSVALPGAALRSQRERLGLTVGAIAQATRFSPAQVEALECDDYQRLPGLTMVRGLVRSYAKYMHMDPVPLLAMMDGIAPATVADVRPPGNLGAAQPRNGGVGMLRKLMVVTGLVLLLVLVAYGILSQQRAASGVGAQTRPKPGVKTPETAVPAVNPVQQPISAAAPAAPLTPAAPVAPTTQGAAIPAESPASKSTLEGAARSNEGGAAAMPGGDVAQSASPVAAVSASAQAQPLIQPRSQPQPQAIVQPVLSLAFDGTSWVEVRDAANKVVLSGAFTAGTVQKIEGKPPFHVWLGQAPLVRVSLGERRIDLQPYTRAGVARLTVQ
jgi:cytoskeleton protein RodZ